MKKKNVKPTESDYLDDLINKHWEYISSLLNTHGVQDMKRVEFHYKTAFKHGWKHHKNYVEEK